MTKLMDESRGFAFEMLMEARSELHTESVWHAYDIFADAANQAARSAAIYLSEPGSMVEAATHRANAYLILSRQRSVAARRKATESLARSRKEAS